MTGWLDALGPLKWPSILLILSPLAAYPFWLPDPGPAADCGWVTVNGRSFRAYRPPDSETFILRPSSKSVHGPTVTILEPLGVEAGGMIVRELHDNARKMLTCSAQID